MADDENQEVTEQPKVAEESGGATKQRSPCDKPIVAKVLSLVVLE